ncbi:hypothetical protein [Cupriavidus campinensis]|uniref:hypothetical protein n=1 Tax=Cupriavidus campinensis TaxID=151783 RepID=UPI001656824A|nr:hypothetical protein [Cupriavidus campinensis]
MGDPVRKRVNCECAGSVVKITCFGNIGARHWDFEEAGFSPIVAGALARAFVANVGHTSIENCMQCWRAIRYFARSLQGKRVGDEARLPQDALLRFKGWLSRRPDSPNTSQTHLNFARRLILWCARNVPQSVDRRIRLTVPPFVVVKQERISKALPDVLVKRILAACYQEIEQAEYRIGLGCHLRVFHGPPNPRSLLERTCRNIFCFGSDGTVGKAYLLAHKRSPATKLARQFGGLSEVDSYLRLKIDQIFPFYLAILVQTGANPMALLQARYDCVQPHPIREDLERLIWAKPRAGREQFADFPCQKTWSAPNLVRRLARLNEPLRSMCRPEEVSALFVASSRRQTLAAAVVSWQSLHDNLNAFVQRHKLESFFFSSFRATVARAHHLASKSIEGAQRRLSHQSPTTTALYTPASDRAHEHERMIARFQGQLVTLAMKKQVKRSPDSIAAAGTSSALYETVFGFACRDPLSGIAPNSVAGKTCLQFHRCASCPGALIPLDDVTVVARLVATYEELKRAHTRAVREGWSIRFRALYEPTLRILSDDILPAVSDSVMAHARSLANRWVLPRLE